MNADALLKNVVAEGLEKCVNNLSRISCGKWRLAGAQIRSGTFNEISAIPRPRAEDGVAVYFEVAGGYPFTAMIIFRTADIPALSRCLFGTVFSHGVRVNQPDELMLSEVGNIILNSVAGALSRALKQVCLPSVPKLVRGESEFLLEALWAAIDKNSRNSFISLDISFECDDVAARAEVVGVIPAGLREALEKTALNCGKKND